MISDFVEENNCGQPNVLLFPRAFSFKQSAGLWIKYNTKNRTPTLDLRGTELFQRS